LSDDGVQGEQAPAPAPAAGPDWVELFTAAELFQPPPVQARTFVQRYASASAPVELICEDGHAYVTKCMRPNNPAQAHMMFNDQCAARLGRFMGAPVPTVSLVNVSAELIAQNNELAHILPGLAHGSLKVPNVTDRVNSFDHSDKGTNRLRFASLAIFFGWLGGSDQQFIFEKATPFNVYSHDHGHFFPGGPLWTVPSLAAAPPAQAWNKLVTDLNLTAAELQQACAPLHNVTPEQIAQSIAFCPTNWGVDQPARIALANFLNDRMQTLRATHPLI
jgi:hypothetical protein